MQKTKKRAYQIKKKGQANKSIKHKVKYSKTIKITGFYTT